jgi:hypothetical protein
MKQPITILQAIADTQLLGAAFKRKFLQPDTWRAWRSFFAAADGLPFEDREAYDTFKACTGRVTAPTKPFSEIYLSCGRRAGKSHNVAALAVFRSAFIDYSQFLAPGETGVCAVIAADRAQAMTILKYVRGFIQASPVLRGMLISDNKEVLGLSNGIEICVLTADFRSVRSRTLVAVIIDELAFVGGSDSASSDWELLAALRPALLSIPGSVLVGLSSPYSKKGELYRMYQQNFGLDDSDVLFWRASSRTMNPTLSERAIAAAFLRDPVSAKTEFNAEFRDDLSGYLSEAQVDSVTIRGRFLLPRLLNTSYVAFVDMSGGKSDSATLAIAHEENGRAILDLLVERGAPHSPEEVTQEFCGILKRFGISEVTSDKYAANWSSDAYQRLGIVHRPSERNRSEIYLNFLPAVLSGQVELLDVPKLKSQLVGLERRCGRNQDLIDHGPGAHDDLSNAAAGALSLALEGGGGFSLLNWVSSGRAHAFANRVPVPARRVTSPEDNAAVAGSKAEWWEREKKRLMDQM